MKKLFVCSFFVFALISALCTMSIFPAMPGKMNYQGKLTDNQGDLINGTRDIDFALYTDAASSFAVWTESHASVKVTNGLFNVVLGETNNLSSTFDSYDSLYLEIEVGGETLSPRQEMASAGYALKAQSTYQDAAYPMETYVVKAGGMPGVDCDFTALSDAIAAAGSGDCSIFVKNGTYIENITIGGIWNIIIRGESHSAVLKNNGSSHTIDVNGEGSNLTIGNLRIEIGETGKSAIYFSTEDFNKVMVSNCEIVSTASGAAYGIGHVGMSNFTLINNVFETTPPWHKGTAISAGGNDSLITGNIFQNWEKGISLNGNENTVIANSFQFDDSPGTVGIEMNSTRRNVVSANEMRRAYTGIALDGSDGDIVSENQLFNVYYYGVYVTGYSRKYSINDNGIHVWADGDPHVDVAIYAGGTGTHNVISGNNVQTNDNNSEGIYVGSDNTLVTGNQVYTLTATGSIAVEVDSDENLIGNNYNYVDTGNELYEAPGHTGNQYYGNWNNDTS